MWKIIKDIKKGDYVYALVPDHPNATKNGYVLKHRVVMENHIGRLLTSDEIVHHKDENKKNNEIWNLEIKTNAQHVREHNSTGRTMVKLNCPNCGKEFERPKNQTHLVKGYRNPTACSKSCRGKFSRRQQLSTP